MQVTYEIPAELLLELMALSNVAAETFDELKEWAPNKQDELDYAEMGWRSFEAWRWLVAIRDGQAHTPQAFDAVHCLKCGDRTDTGEVHDCEVDITPP